MAADRLQQITDHAIDAGLFDHRVALLQHLPNRTRGAMVRLARPAEQLSSDLNFLHGLPASQIAHLIGWLRAAARLTVGADRAFFAAQIEQLERAHPPPGLRIRWRFAVNTPPLGDVRLPVDTRFAILGRRHLCPPARFVPLISAPWRVSPRHVGIEVLADGLRIKRPGGAGMLDCEGWLSVGASRVVGRTADLNLGGALRVLIEVS